MNESPAIGPLRILMCITPRHFSGAERVLVNLAGGLQERGHRVLVLTKPLARLMDELAARSVPVEAAPISGKLNRHAARHIAQVAEAMGADLIYTSLSSASLWGGRAGLIADLPVVSHVLALNHARWYVRATRILALSHGVKQHLVRQGIPEARIDVVYSGVDRALMESARPREEVRGELGLPQAAPVICAVAHLHRKKGHRYLVEAIARLVPDYPQLQLLCAGRDSGELAALRRQVRRLGVEQHVQFLGFRGDVLDIVNASDVVVLPSVAKEGLGLALVEGAYLGKPTVGSDIPGIREALVDGETGFLVPPARPEALAQRLGQLLSDRELRRRMGAAGREWARKTFDLQRQMELTEATFAKAIATHRHARIST